MFTSTLDWVAKAATFTHLDSPKSKILTQFVVVSTDIFDGFKSLWTIPAARMVQ